MDRSLRFLPDPAGSDHVPELSPARMTCSTCPTSEEPAMVLLGRTTSVPESAGWLFAAGSSALLLLSPGTRHRGSFVAVGLRSVALPQLLSLGHMCHTQGCGPDVARHVSPRHLLWPVRTDKV